MRPRRTGVSPALVLRAQNLVSAEILSEKLLHPPRSVGTGVDEMSHAAVQEGSINRPISVGGGESATGKQSIGERSFDVFQDDNDDVMSGMEILPKELTRPTQVGQRTTPPVEKRPPPPRPQLDESPARKAPQLQNTEPQPPSSFARSEKEYDEEELDEYDENGVLVPPTERRYYRSETRGSSLDRISEFDRVDYEQPETYSDDEELLGEDFEEEEDLHHAGYYFQDRRTRREEEEYYEEEEYSDEDEDVREVEEKNPVQGNAPEVVDLTLDSSEEESQDVEDEITVLKPRLDEFEESESEEEEEEYQDDYEDQSSWAGIKSNASFTDASRSTPQLGPFGFFFDDNLMPHLPGTADLSNPFSFTPSQPQSLVQPEFPSFPADLLSQTLDPSMFQSRPSLQSINDLSGPTSASLLDSVLLFQTDPLNLSSTTLPLPSTMMSEARGLETTLSSVPPKRGDVKGNEVYVVDTTAEQEFLMGLLPTGDQISVNESTQPRESREFLPNIIPDRAQESRQESLISPKRRFRTESHVDGFPDAAMKDVQPRSEVYSLDSLEQESRNTQSSRSLPRQRPRSPSPTPLSDEWRKEGLITPLGFYPPIIDIGPPSLRAQKEGRSVDLIGVIRESTEIAKAKGADYFISLHIVDPSTGPNNGLSTLLFRPHKSALPTNPPTGSVIILTNMKVLTLGITKLINRFNLLNIGHKFGLRNQVVGYYSLQVGKFRILDRRWNMEMRNY